MAGAHRDNQASTGVGDRDSLPTSAHSVCADRVCQMEEGGRQVQFKEGMKLSWLACQRKIHGAYELILRMLKIKRKMSLIDAA